MQKEEKEMSKITIKHGKVEVKSMAQHRLLHAKDLTHTHQKKKNGKIQYIRHGTKKG